MERYLHHIFSWMDRKKKPNQGLFKYFYMYSVGLCFCNPFIPQRQIKTQMLCVSIEVIQIKLNLHLYFLGTSSFKPIELEGQKE